MDIKLTVPDSLADITLGDYQKFMKISEGKEMDIFIQQKMVQIFCHIPLLAVTHIKVQDFKKIVSHLVSVLEQKSALIPITEVDGKKYGFIPNLDRDMTIGEYIDLDKFMETWDTFDKAMGVLYRPVTSKSREKYLISDYDPNIDISYTKQITMDVVTGATLFFWTLSAELLKITPNYLRKLIQKTGTQEEVTAAFEKNGVGIHTFLRSLEETSLGLEKLLPPTLARHSRS